MDSEEIKQRFGARVRELRQAKEISQEQLGFDAGLDRTYINSVEQGNRNVSLVNIVRIAEALDVPTSELFVVKKARGK